MQNIGAYGLELAERLESVTVYDRASESVRMLTREACDFGYRHSIFKTDAGKDLVVLSATLRLPGEWAPVMTYKGLDEALGGAEPTPGRTRSGRARDPREEAPRPEGARERWLLLQEPRGAEGGRAAAFDRAPKPCCLSARRRAREARGGVAHRTGGTSKATARGPWASAKTTPSSSSTTGGATGEDVERLMKEITAGVEAKFGIALEPEPVFLR